MKETRKAVANTGEEEKNPQRNEKIFKLVDDTTIYVFSSSSQNETADALLRNIRIKSSLEL